MGSKLFERTTRSVTQTDFGASMTGDMRGIVDAKSRLLLNSAEYLACDDHVVRIGMSPLISDEYVAAMLAHSAMTDGSPPGVLQAVEQWVGLGHVGALSEQ